MPVPTPGRSEVELAGIGLRVCDEFGDGRDRDRLVHHQDGFHYANLGNFRVATESKSLYKEQTDSLVFPASVPQRKE